MSRHISTPEERERLLDAGWYRDADDWWWPERVVCGMGRTACDALRAERKRRKRAEREGGR